MLCQSARMPRKSAATAAVEARRRGLQLMIQPLGEHDFQFITGRLETTFYEHPAVFERAIEAAWLWRITPLKSDRIDSMFFPETAYLTGTFTAREWLVPLFTSKTVDVPTLQLLLDVLRIHGDAKFALTKCCHTFLRMLIAEVQQCVHQNRPFHISTFADLMRTRVGPAPVYQ